MRQRALTLASDSARQARASASLGRDRTLRFGALGRHVLRVALAALLAAALQSCVNTPTLPLPPPVASVGAPNLQGLVRVEGQANEEAYVTVLNQTTDSGQIGRADLEGHFAIDIAASAGDQLLIWQELDGVSGERTEQTVPAPLP
jgi:hypothetical protein